MAGLWITRCYSVNILGKKRVLASLKELAGIKNISKNNKQIIKQNTSLNR